MTTTADTFKPPHLSGTLTPDVLHEAAARTTIATSDRGFEALGYEAAHFVLNDKRFSKTAGFIRRIEDIGIVPGSESREDWDVFLMASEGELRDNLRVMFAGMMRPGQVRKFTSTVESIADEVVAEIGDVSGFDVMREVAWKIPSRMYCELVSAPQELAPTVARLSDSIVAPTLAIDPSRRREAIDALYETLALVTEHIAARRENMGDDFTSFMIQHQLDGRLTERELLLNAVALLIVSTDNTANQTGLVIERLLDEPGVWQRLAENPDLIPAAVEEAIRLNPRVYNIMRKADVDVEVEGYTVPEGTIAFASVLTGNRDPRVLDNPHEFDLDRPLFRQLEFGGGAFNCLGQHLARVEIQQAVRALVSRFPNLTHAGERETAKFTYGTEVRELRVVA